MSTLGWSAELGRRRGHGHRVGGGFVAVLGLGGCGALGHDCTSMGCVQNVTLELASPLVDAGEYTFTLTTGGTTATCTAFIPLRRDGSEPSCDTMSINREENTTRSGDAIIGTAGDPIASVSIPGDLDSLTLSVLRDGTEIIRAQLSPVYRGVEINGPGCGECPMATETIGG